MPGDSWPKINLMGVVRLDLIDHYDDNELYLTVLCFEEEWLAT